MPPIHRLALAGLLLATPALTNFAWAQDRPTLLPTRDVAITYRSGDATELRLAWLPARGLMRMDLPGGQGWMIADTRAGTGFVVVEAQRVVMDLPPGRAPAPGLNPSANARFTREGPARIANLDCVNWRVEDGGETGRICVTADGVMLRAESLRGGSAQAGEGRLEAVAVAYAPQDPARFQRPQGYPAIQMPRAPQPTSPGSGPPPARGQDIPRGSALPPPGLAPPPVR